MERFIDEGPRQLVEAHEACRTLPAHPEARSAMLLAMGGSALGGGLVEMLRYQQQAAWPWHVVRDYRLPALPDPRTRLFALSYSVETEEVLAALADARAGAAQLLAVSAGGKLADLARREGLPWLGIPAQPAGFQPRFALYFMFGVLYEVLVRDGLLRGVCHLPDAARRLEQLDQREQGREIAAFLGSRIPVIYSDTVHESGVARTWRIKLNENAKTAALAGAMPESNHNELIAFPREEAGRFAFVLLTDPDGDVRVGRRFELFAELMRHYGHPVMEVPLSGADPVEKALASLKLADWVSLYLARARGVDPVAIPAIQDFKQRLGRGRQ
jgi:glucose/mannose-6-phosphate isomerase